MHASSRKDHYPNIFETGKSGRYSFGITHFPAHGVSVVKVRQEEVWTRLFLARNMPSIYPTQTYQAKNYGSSGNSDPKNPSHISLGSQETKTPSETGNFFQNYSLIVKNQRRSQKTSQLQTAFVSKWSWYETG